MADARFFKKSESMTLADIADKCDCVLHNQADGAFVVEDVAPLDAAGTVHLSFLDNTKYRDMFVSSKAAACIVSEAAVEAAPVGMRLLVSKNPYRSYALAATLFYPAPKADGVIAPSAQIMGEVMAGASIGHNVVIEAGAVVGAGAIIEHGAIIGAGVQIGDGCWIGANVTISHAVLGRGVRVHNGARIGQEGFGFAISPAGHVPVPQLGRVMIGDGVNIGANTTIDRGAGPDTVIGDGCFIDNLCQIGHNVRMGRGCVLVAQVGVSGSTVLGDFVVLGGQVGVAGHLNIGTGAKVAAQSGVTKDIPAGQEWVGFPAAPRMAFWREHARLKKLLGAQRSTR